MIKVLLAIPNMGNIEQECLRSICSLNIPADTCFDIELITGYGVALARNRAAAKAISEGYDYVFFVDGDQILPADALEKLLSHNVDIVSGWTIMAVGESYTNVSYYNAEKNAYEFVLRDSLPAGLMSIDGIGCACMLVKTSVFASLDKPYFRYVEYEDGSVLSEDLYFCNTAKRQGFNICCDTSLKAGHIKKIVL